MAILQKFLLILSQAIIIIGTHDETIHLQIDVLNASCYYYYYYSVY